MGNTVFFSWQSDRPTREGRNLIDRALETAVQRISQDLTVDEPLRGQLCVDKDRRDVPGSPPIFDTIRQKIERAAIFFPDLTFVCQRQNGEPVPNPNVLFEYGYALKCLTHHRIVGVMNDAYGEPSRASLPFDLAHYRFPITYHLTAEASEEARRNERERLSKTLETALRGVLESEEYKSTLPKPPVPPPKYREPLQGRARFRANGEAIGVTNDPLSRMQGNKDWQVKLADGPAIWLRVMPKEPPSTPLKITELRQLVMVLMRVPLFSAHSNVFALRGSDGAGLCMPLTDGPSPSVVFVFTDAEIWIIDTYLLNAYPQLLAIDESKFVESLQQCVSFLSERLSTPGPYRWVVGMEGISGRSLPLPGDRFRPLRGLCVADRIEEEGVFNLGQDSASALEPFFAKLFEYCGIERARAGLR